MKRKSLLVPTVVAALLLGFEAVTFSNALSSAKVFEPVGSIAGQDESDFANENLSLLFWCTSAVAKGDTFEAQRICGEAIAFDPENPAPYKLRGASYLAGRRYGEAHADFAKAIELESTDAESHLGYAEALSGEGDYQGAIIEFSTTIALSPGDPRPWAARCWTHGLFVRKLRAGLTDCETARRLAPFDPDVLASRGLIYLRTGELGNAIKDFNSVLALVPDFATARYARGAARLRGGDRTGAQQDIICARAADSSVDTIFSQKPLIPPHLFSAVSVPTEKCELHGKITEEGKSSS